MSIRRPQDFRLILASSSPYRQALLMRLGLQFDSIPADIDEAPRSKELPKAYVQRLAQEKAAKIAASHPEAVVIGSDQCAIVDGNIVGKPGNRAAAIRQLQTSSGGRNYFFDRRMCRAHKFWLVAALRRTVFGWISRSVAS